MRNFFVTTIIALLAAPLASAAEGGKAAACDPAACCEGRPDCCAHCGACGCCQKVCRMVCDVKEVKKKVFEVQCKEFFPTLPGCGRECGRCCDEQGNCADCGCSSKHDPCAEYRRPAVPPKCGHVRSAKVLVAKEVVCKVPTYKCVVQYLCGNCSHVCGAEPVPEVPVGVAPSPPAAPIPPPPAPLR